VPAVGPDPLAPLVARVRAGDRAALEALVGEIRDDVYNLALGVREEVADMERLHAAAALLRSHPRYAAPGRVAEEVLRIVRTGGCAA
jgi:hypothetical protein